MFEIMKWYKGPGGLDKSKSDQDLRSTASELSILLETSNGTHLLTTRNPTG